MKKPRQWKAWAVVWKDTGDIVIATRTKSSALLWGQPDTHWYVRVTITEVPR